MVQGRNQENKFPTATDPGHSHPFSVVTRALTWGSLRSTILYWFLAISLIPVIFVSLVGHKSAEKSRLDDYFFSLHTVSELERQELSTRFQGLQESTARQARNLSTVELLSQLESDLVASGQKATGWVRSQRWTNLVTALDAPIRTFRKDSKAPDVFLTNRLGEILFSCEQQEDLGTSLLLGIDAHSKLGAAAQHVLETGESAFAGFEQYQSRERALTAFYAEPVKTEYGETLGLIIVAVGPEYFVHRTTWSTLVAPCTQFYVVDESLVLLVSPDQKPGNRLLREEEGHSRIRFWQNSLTDRRDPKSKLSTMGAAVATESYRGINGKEVLGVIRDLEILGTHFALVFETPKTEVLAGLKRMGYSLLLVVLVVGFLVTIAGFFVAYRTVDPINQLGRVMQRVSDGHEVWDPPLSGPKEVRRLTDMFHFMIKKMTEAQKVNERQYTLKRCQFELNEKLRGEPKIEVMAAGVLEYLGDYFGAQMGVFYLVESRDVFRLAAQFGVHDQSMLAKEIRTGQGILGQAVANNRIQVLRGVAEERHKMETGLTKLSVNSLILAPIHLEGRTLGVLELGMLADIRDEDLELIRLVGESIAVAINSGRSRERVHRLLRETWSQTAALSKQQKQLKESNKQLERANQYKSEFLANMSHELRTPLNSLLIMSQVLAENRHQNLSREEVDSAQTINRAGSDLLLLINDILDLSRVEAGKLALCFDEFDLVDLVKEMEQLFSPLAKKQGVEFQTVLGSSIPRHMISDPLRLTQILKNILNNAFKFTEKGRVTFSVRRPEPGEVDRLENEGDQSWLEFSIRDTGVGIPAATLSSIFEVFNQGDGSIARRYGGSGLGLSISSKLCEMLGGQLRVESVEGEGSTFSLLLPVKVGMGGAQSPMLHRGPDATEMEVEPSDVKTTDQESDSPPDPVNLKGRRILLCDDDMRTVFQVTEILDGLGAEVILAPSWIQGVEEATNNPDFDFAVVGPNLADGPTSGDLTDWKRECGGPTFPVLALVLAADGPHCAGADFTGKRPVVRGEFVALVKKALAFEPVVEATILA